MAENPQPEHLGLSPVKQYMPERETLSVLIKLGMLDQVLMLLTRNREVLPFESRLATDYPEFFLRFSSARLGMCRIMPDRFLPPQFQFIIHYHPTTILYEVQDNNSVFQTN
jgi:hypothetical protein